MLLVIGKSEGQKYGLTYRVRGHHRASREKRGHTAQSNENRVSLRRLVSLLAPTTIVVGTSTVRPFKPNFLLEICLVTIISMATIHSHNNHHVTIVPLPLDIALNGFGLQVALAKRLELLQKGKTPILCRELWVKVAPELG